MLFLCIAFAVIFPYLLCSVNPAIIITKIKSGKDIRELGSGGAGLTNTLRTQGKSAAVIVLLFDVLKGVISVFATKLFFYLVYPQGFCDVLHLDGQQCLDILLFNQQLCVWIAALMAVLGHCFPVYYKFKGGKAVLVTVATGLVINWLAALIALVIFIIIVAISRYVSLGSCIAAVCYPVCVYFTSESIVGTVFTGIIALILIYKHKGNIKRLINKTENKLGVKKIG